MVNIIYGKAASGKTTYLIKELNKALKNGKRCFFFVPEQYSLAAERMLCESVSDELMPLLETVSFKQFSEIVFELTAEFQNILPSATGKNVLMSIALNSVADQLTVFRKHKNDCGFIVELTRLYDEFNEYDVQFNEMNGENGSVGEKLKDISLIFGAYSSLCKNNVSEYTACAELINKEKLFIDSYFFFDGFNGFTPNEYDVIKAVMRNSEALYLTLHTSVSEDKTGGYGVFSDVISTLTQFKTLAHDLGKKCNLIKTEFESGNFIADFLEERLFTSSNEAFSNCKGITLYSLNNPFNEVSATAAIIKENVQKGAKYSDFAVISSSNDDYRSCYEAVFNEYNIPYFDDSRGSVIKKPLSRFLLTVLEPSFLKPDTKHIITALKTGITGADDGDINDFENYAYMWNLRYWQLSPDKSFIRNPNKVSAEFSDKDNADLARLNSFKKTVIDPICILIKQLSDAMPKKKIELLYGYFERYGVADNLRKRAQMLIDDGFSYLADEEEQLWDIIIALFDELYAILPDKEMDNKLFYYLFKTAISSLSVGKIPHFQNSVTVGELGRIRIGRKKYVIFVGANDKLLPKSVSESPILNDYDIFKMKELGISSLKTSVEKQQHYRLDFIQAITRATDELYVLRHKIDAENKPAYPAAVYNELISLIPNVEREFDQSRLYCTEKKLLDLYGELSFNEGCELNNVVIGNKFASLKERIETMKEMSNTESISGDLAKDLYYNSQSYSSVSTFRNCAYAYFCKYGLKLKGKEHFEINHLNRGDFIHYCLEHALKTEGFYDLSDREVADLSKSIANEYIALNFSSANEQSPRYRYYFENLISKLTDFLIFTRNESKVSLFRPSDFELDIKRTEGVEPLKINIDDNHEILFSGKIDRVDVYETESEKYLRVVDYKTGNKDFNIKNIANGLDLQMFIYLFALIKNGRNYYGKELKPAAVMYIKGFLNTDDADLLNEKQEKSITKGLFLNDQNVIKAMDADCFDIKSSKYIPISFKTDGSYTKKATEIMADLERFGKLEKYVMNALNSMVKDIYAGKIEKAPLDVDYNDCDRCDYLNVCGKSYKNKQKVANAGWEEIENGEFNG